MLLFDGDQRHRLYKVTRIGKGDAHLRLVADFDLRTPKNTLHLFWSLLTKDKNDWVLQKCTELGVSYFVPIVTERTTKTGFNSERAQKIIIEAAEQCGRTDIPSLHDQLTLSTAIATFREKIPLHVAEEGGSKIEIDSSESGVFIGPEGGWSEKEKKLFQDSGVQKIALHPFTLRAETACVVAATKLIQ